MEPKNLARGRLLTGLDHPRAVALDERTVACELVEHMIVPRQCLDHDLARIAQRGNGGPQRIVLLPRRENRVAASLDRRDPGELAQIEREAGRRTRTAVRSVR